MKRTELLQEVQKMRFEEAYSGWSAPSAVPGSSPACAPPSNPPSWAVVTTMLAPRSPDRQKAGSVSEVIGPRLQIVRKSLKKIHYK